MLKSSLRAATSALCLGLLACVGFVSQADAATKCVKGDQKTRHSWLGEHLYT